MGEVKLGIVSTYPPTPCGVGEYCWHLVQELKNKGNIRIILYPIEEKRASYEEEVGCPIKKGDHSSYIRAGREINRSKVDLVIIQHQFLLFGEEGRYTGEFLKEMDRPIMAIIHTVPGNPSPVEREALISLREKANFSVVMIEEAKKILGETYGFPQEKIEVIHHPFPSLPRISSLKARKILGLPEESFIIATFGLIRKEKGIEDVLEALSYLKKENILYLVLGETHPNHHRKEGDEYLDSLKKKARELGVEDKVRWVNHYLSEEELGKYLSATDVYLTPYHAKEQVSSGSLAYALGMGKVVISTPFPFAREMLGGDRGILVNFHSPGEIALRLRDLMYNKERKESLQRKVEALSQEISWQKAGEKFFQLIRRITGCWA